MNYIDVSASLKLSRGKRLPAFPVRKVNPISTTGAKLIYRIVEIASIFGIMK